MRFQRSHHPFLVRTCRGPLEEGSLAPQQVSSLALHPAEGTLASAECLGPAALSGTAPAGLQDRRLPLLQLQLPQLQLQLQLQLHRVALVVAGVGWWTKNRQTVWEAAVCL